MQRRTQAARDARRRAWGIVAIVLWVLGFEIGPGVHVALHDHFGAHSHEGDRGVARDDRDHPGARDRGRAHDHGHDHDHDHDHDHGHDHVHVHVDEGVDVDVEVDADEHRVEAGIDRGDHGRHSLAHRGVAVIDPPAAMPRVDSAPWVAAARVQRGHDPVFAVAPLTVRARGPPLHCIIS